MLKFSELKRIPLREKWNHEASDFTPWLESNIQMLGDAFDSELEEIREWHIKNLLKMKKVFQPEIEQVLETLV